MDCRGENDDSVTENRPNTPLLGLLAAGNITRIALSARSGVSLRVIKTHLPLGRLPMNADAKYIYVVRDPKDVFVSSYHFVRDVALGPLMPSVANWLKVYLSPDVSFGSWAQHLQGRGAERPGVRGPAR